MKYGNEREHIAKAIVDVIQYFSLFQYAPSNKEIMRYVSEKTTTQALKDVLLRLEQEKKVISSQKHMPSGSIYAIPGHSILFRNRIVREAYTHEKLQKLRLYFSILSLCSFIKLIGISGSCAMHSATKNDDVDIFIVTAHKRLWLGRLWAIILAKALRVHRHRNSKNISGKICLNMFFDEADLALPLFKQNLYTAHEVAQMRCIHMRQGAYTYGLFLQANKWIRHYFPNITIPRCQMTAKNTLFAIVFLSRIGDIFEFMVKRLQLILISRHQTHEMITDTQLWFFPKDFEKKVRKLLRRHPFSFDHI